MEGNVKMHNSVQYKREETRGNIILPVNSTCLTAGVKAGVCVCMCEYMRASVSLWTKSQQAVKRELMQGISNADNCITLSNVPTVSPETA